MENLRAALANRMWITFCVGQAGLLASLLAAACLGPRGAWINLAALLLVTGTTTQLFRLRDRRRRLEYLRNLSKDWSNRP